MKQRIYIGSRLSNLLPPPKLCFFVSTYLTMVQYKDNEYAKLITDVDFATPPFKLINEIISLIKNSSCDNFRNKKRFNILLLNIESSGVDL